jgi:hypothetical protein
MGDYRTIKDLVVETYFSEGGVSSFEKLTSLVRKYFPKSKWKKTHYAWYKAKIKAGDIEVPSITGRRQEPNSGATDVEIEEVVEASVSLERDLHLYYPLG